MCAGHGSVLISIFYMCRTAGAIRTASMTCIQALLQSSLLSHDQLSLALDDLLPKVRPCTTRVYI